jgi:hypothetical protein
VLHFALDHWQERCSGLWLRANVKIKYSRGVSFHPYRGTPSGGLHTWCRSGPRKWDVPSLGAGLSVALLIRRCSADGELGIQALEDGPKSDLEGVLR